jgi:hypothetical protein
VSQVALVPQLKLGIAVLTNQESTSAYWAIIYHLLDHYMQTKPFDWIKAFKIRMDSSVAESKENGRKRTSFLHKRPGSPGQSKNIEVGIVTSFMVIL